MRYNERVAMEDPEVTYNNIRRAAEVHRQVRSHARKFIRPGMRLLDIAEEIETSARALVEESGLESGIGFPTGLNINDCAAHYSPNPGDTTGERCVSTAVVGRSLQHSFHSAKSGRCSQGGLWHSCQRADTGFRIHADMGPHV